MEGNGGPYSNICLPSFTELRIEVEIVVHRPAERVYVKRLVSLTLLVLWLVLWSMVWIPVAPAYCRLAFKVGCRQQQSPRYTHFG